MDGISDSMDVTLSALQELVLDKEDWRAIYSSHNIKVTILFIYLFNLLILIGG